MNSGGRSRRRELVEEAYNLQVKAGLMASRIHFPFKVHSHSHSLCALCACVRAILPKIFYALFLHFSL